VFFSTAVPPLELCGLKSVERLFACAVFLQGETVQQHSQSTAQLAKLLVSSGEWEKVHSAWCDSPAGTHDDGATTFRVSCKVSGSASRRVDHKDLSRRVAAGLHNERGWIGDARSFSMEISIQANDERITAGVALSHEPLSLRRYMPTPGLRCTVAWAMVSMARQAATPSSSHQFLVVDPMCGAGTVVCEAVSGWDDALGLCIDNNPEQLTLCRRNVDTANIGGRVGVVLGDVKTMPLRDHVADAVVVDAPFGLKHKTTEDLAYIYDCLVREASRVLRVGGACVVLTSKPQLILQSAKRDNVHLRLLKQHQLRLGVLDATICVWRRV